MRIDAPFTVEQARALNAYQADSRFHPFTCGRDTRHGPLRAFENSCWLCTVCDYRQTWAHDFMLTDANSPTVSRRQVSRIVKVSASVDDMLTLYRSCMDQTPAIECAAALANFVSDLLGQAGVRCEEEFVKEGTTDLSRFILSKR